MSDEETFRTCELERYFAVLPAFRSLYREIEYSYNDVLGTALDKAYHSANEPALGKKELRDFLIQNQLIEEFEECRVHPSERYWP
jgi:hypothetical protein